VFWEESVFKLEDKILREKFFVRNGDSSNRFLSVDDEAVGAHVSEPDEEAEPPVALAHHGLLAEHHRARSLWGEEKQHTFVKIRVQIPLRCKVFRDNS
jgi:hypothetical protein